MRPGDPVGVLGPSLPSRRFAGRGPQATPGREPVQTPVTGCRDDGDGDGDGDGSLVTDVLRRVVIPLLPWR